MTGVLAALLAALVVTAAATPLVRRLASALGVVARPTHERWHRAPVPLLGGVGIVAGFMAAALPAAGRSPLLLVLSGAAAMFVVGLVDDLWHLRPAAKLGAQVLIAGILVGVIPTVRLTGMPIVDTALAVIWVVGITNAFNLLDNVDGLASGIALLAGTFFLGTLWPDVSGPVPVALAALVGAASGFLIYNFHPASIFMGDSGSLFLGFCLSALSLVMAPLQPHIPSFAVVSLLVLLVPIFDTTFVTLTRKMSGRSPLAGGRDHASHRLIALGISERRAVVVHYALTTTGGLIALGVLHASPGNVGIALGLYAIALAALGIVLGHVEIAHLQAGGRPPERLMLSEISYRNRALEVLLDAALIGFAYYAAYALRFQGEEFARFLPYFGASFPIVLACQIAGLWVSGKYRELWRRFGAAELVTTLRGVALGVAASVIGVLYLYRFEGFSRLVFAFDSVILAALLIGARVAVNRLDEYLLRQRESSRRVLLYGAGRRGVLLVHDLLGTPHLNLVPIGFLDDDPAKRRLRIEGLRVLGGFGDIEAVLAKHRPDEVIVSTEHIAGARLDAIEAACRAHNVGVRRLRMVLEHIVSREAAEQVRHG
jgi:UDP-GlcNAc:undecaprenyl-phosphate GlcNAc-1-phosphate transferase